MIKNILCFSLILSLLSFCTKKSSDSNAPTEEKNVSELTMQDIFSMALLSENTARIAHTKKLKGKDAFGSISIYADGVCGLDNCGVSLIMENKDAKKSIFVIVKLKFKLPNNKNNTIERRYEVKAKESISIGCSHICHQENSYMIQREIVYAVFSG